VISVISVISVILLSCVGAHASSVSLRVRCVRMRQIRRHRTPVGLRRARAGRFERGQQQIVLRTPFFR
jgi:hypothetical protein